MIRRTTWPQNIFAPFSLLIPPSPSPHTAPPLLASPRHAHPSAAKQHISKHAFQVRGEPPGFPPAIQYQSHVHHATIAQFNSCICDLVCRRWRDPQWMYLSEPIRVTRMFNARSQRSDTSIDYSYCLRAFAYLAEGLS